MTSDHTGDKPLLERKAAAAEHIALEATRLARIANANDFRLIAYLIDMVVLEAWRETSEPDESPDSQQDAARANG